MSGMQHAEQQRRDKQQVTLSRKRKANSGENDDEAPTKRHEDTSRYNEPPDPNEPAGGDEEEVILWALHEPADFDRKLQEMLQPGARPSHAYEISWERLRRVQAWDETTNGQLRMMPWARGSPPGTSTATTTTR
jgi:hypothetical protein